MTRLTQPQISSPAAAQHSAQYLTFLLGGEMFGIGILTIKEIIEFHEVTPVPMMPRCVRGVINLRGAVVPVVDLQARFGRQPTPVTKRTCIVIVELGMGSEIPVMGVVVDGVSEVLDITASDIEPAPAFGTQMRTDFIAGMAKVRDRFVILLSAEDVLAIDELAALAGERQLAAPALA